MARKSTHKTIASSIPNNYKGSKYKGTGETVVVIGNGTSDSYKNKNVIYQHDFYNNDNYTFSVDPYSSLDGQIIQGVATNVNIIHLKVGPDRMSSPYYDSSKVQNSIIQALQWVHDHADDKNPDGSLKYGDIVAVDLAQIHYSPTNTTLYGSNPLDKYISLLNSKNITTVLPTGGWNGKQGVDLWAASPYAIAVAESKVGGQSGELAPHTQRDPKLTDISAPGEFYFANKHHIEFPFESGGFSASVVAGAVALMQDAAKTLLGAKLRFDEIEAIIQYTSAPAKAGVALGYHRIDIDSAIKYIETHQDYLKGLVGVGNMHSLYEPNLGQAAMAHLVGDFSNTFKGAKELAAGKYNYVNAYLSFQDPGDMYKFTVPKTIKKGVLILKLQDVYNTGMKIELYKKAANDAYVPVHLDSASGTGLLKFVLQVSSGTYYIKVTTANGEKYTHLDPDSYRLYTEVLPLDNKLHAHPSPGGRGDSSKLRDKGTTDSGGAHDTGTGHSNSHWRYDDTALEHALATPFDTGLFT